MLSNQTCTNVIYTYRDTNIGEQILIAKKESPAQLGNIIGCAIYFEEKEKPRTVTKEYVVVADQNTNHIEAHVFLYEKHEVFVKIFNNDDTCYGFVTDKGYFVNRDIALSIYKHICEVNKITCTTKVIDKLSMQGIKWKTISNIISRQIKAKLMGKNIFSIPEKKLSIFKSFLNGDMNVDIAKANNLSNSRISQICREASFQLLRDYIVAGNVNGKYKGTTKRGQAYGRHIREMRFHKEFWLNLIEAQSKK